MPTKKKKTKVDSEYAKLFDAKHKSPRCEYGAHIGLFFDGDRYRCPACVTPEKQ